MSEFMYRVRETDGKLLLRKTGGKRIMVLDGYEKNCFVALVARVDNLSDEEKNFAIENIWNALIARSESAVTTMVKEEIYRIANIKRRN